MPGEVMPRSKDIYDLFSVWSPYKRISYAINGIIMGLGAPIGWLLISLLFFRPSGASITSFLIHETTGSLQHILMYLYMTLGTSLVMSVTGYLVGRGFDWNAEKAEQLQNFHNEVEEQKKEFEHRFRQLQNDTSNLYQIGAGIQKSLSTEQILHLIADGAHRILNFDRINIFLLDREKRVLICREARGHHGNGWNNLRVPLSASGGVLVKTIKENKVYRVDDVSKMSKEFRMGKPFDNIPELRSRSFACIPIRERGEPIGLIAVDNKYRKTSIRDEKLSTLQILADQGSVALTNISLFRGIKELHRELERNFEGLLNRREQFSEIVRELSQRTGSISGNVQQVAKNAEELSEAVHETSASVKEMSSSLTEIASGLEGLTDAADDTLSSASAMSASIDEMESHAADSNALSERVKKEAEEGAALAQKSISGIGKIQAIVLEAVKVMQHLGKRTEEINEVLEVINNINEKTSVLALNAAIISTHAGEYGKEFSVVSDEIRNLSERTAASSKEIEEMIESVQQEVRKASTMIESIPEHVGEGVNLSRRSGDALHQIQKSTGTASEMSRKIEEAIQQQVNNAEIVFQSIGKVNDMIRIMTRSIQEQNEGSQIITRANENIREITEQVANSTAQQSEGFQSVAQMVSRVSEMVDSLFSEAEKRREESESIIEGIDVLSKKKSAS